MPSVLTASNFSVDSVTFGKHKPNINGGYNIRANQRLGVNCFGKKPDGVDPEAVEPAKVEQKVAYWQQNLTISPFNYKSWSEF